MTLCYNKLPPHTKMAADKMSEMYDNDYKQWMKYRDKLGYNYPVHATLAAAYWRSHQIEIKKWLEAIKAFELWNDNVATELMSYCLGAKDTNTPT